MCDLVKKAGQSCISVGKIFDIFAGRGLTQSNPIKGNADGMRVTLEKQAEDFEGLCFTNLVDFDMLYGHRNDVAGYASAMTEFDGYLGEFLKGMRSDDILIITADHGCDPATPSTDHSREYTPMLVCGQKIKQGVDLGIRSSFADISATVLEYLGIDKEATAGDSFLSKVSL